MDYFWQANPWLQLRSQLLVKYWDRSMRLKMIESSVHVEMAYDMRATICKEFHVLYVYIYAYVYMFM